MIRNCILSIQLALKDWVFERTLSLCAVLALASMLTPLFVLNGVRVGFVENLRTSLTRNPSALVIIPVGSGVSGYSASLVQSFMQRPEAAFAIPRTRAVAAELEFKTKTGGFAGIRLEATAEGDPLLQRYGVPTPVVDLPRTELVLSAAAARRLGAAPGETLQSRLGRKRPDGVLELITLPFVVTRVLPPEATSQEAAFLPLSALDDIQDYRDYIAVPARQFSGDTVVAQERRYESFRVYARSIDEVEALDAFFSQQDIPVITMAKDVADIRNLDSVLTRIVLVIALAVGLGFMAFTVSSAHAAVRRKDRMLGMMRLLGFPRLALLLYPLTQILVTGVAGSVLAGGFSLGVGAGIDALFASRLMGTSLCSLRADHFFIALGAVLLLSAVAGLRSAVQAAKIDPSVVIREV